jgi:hypothetical protein
MSNPSAIVGWATTVSRSAAQGSPARIAVYTTAMISPGLRADHGEAEAMVVGIDNRLHESLDSDVD